MNDYANQLRRDLRRRIKRKGKEKREMRKEMVVFRHDKNSTVVFVFLTYCFQRNIGYKK